MRRIAIVSINEPGIQSSKMLYSILKEEMSDIQIDVFYKSGLAVENHNTGSWKSYQNIDQLFHDNWKQFDIFICFLATGIVVRKIVPYLESKTTDPAILVMSFDIKQIVPLLSGHIGGANAFAQELIRVIPDSTAFITTATDQTKTFAFDLFAKHYSFDIVNIGALPGLSNALINGHKVRVLTYEPIFELMRNYSQLSQSQFYFSLLPDQLIVGDYSIKTVIISPFSQWNSYVRDSNKLLTIKIKPIYIGIGLNRDTPVDVLEKSLNQFLNEHNLNLADVAGIASFTAKSDEKGLQDLAKKLKLPLSFFNEEEINTITENLSPSKAKDYFNIKGVAEPSAILASKHKTCFLRKHSYYQAVTLAAAF